MAYESLPKKGAATSSDNTSLITQNIFENLTTEETNSFSTVTLNGNVTTIKDAPFKEFAKYERTIEPSASTSVKSVSSNDGITVIGFPYEDHSNGTNIDCGKIFAYNDDGELLWEAENPVPSDYAYFGWDVAVGNNRIVVSAYRDRLNDELPSNTTYYGSFSVYDYDGNFLTRVVPAVGDRVTNMNFAFSVSIGNGYIVIGAPGEHAVNTGFDDEGAIYFYNSSDVSFIEKKGYPPEGVLNGNRQEFGSKVVIGDGKVVVATDHSSFSENNGLGYPEVFVFDLETRSLDSTFRPSNPEDGTSSATPSVAVSGGYVFLGQGGYDDLITSNGGIVDVFTLSGNKVTTLTYPISYGVAGQYFYGSQITAKNGILAVYAPDLDSQKFTNTIFVSGGIILYDIGTLKEYDYALFPRTYAGGNYASGLTISDSGKLLALVGNSNIRSVDIFDLTGSIQILQTPNLDSLKNIFTSAQETSVQTIQTSDDFGLSAAAGNGVIVLGAPGYDSDAIGSSGGAFVTDYDGNLLYELKAPTPTVNRGFGSAVAVGEGIIVVAEYGSPSQEFIDTGGVSGASSNVGALHLFDVVDGTFIQTLYIPSSENPVDNQRLGWSIEESANTPLSIGNGLIVAGAPGNGTVPGYVFVWNTSGTYQYKLEDQTSTTDGSNNFGGSVDIKRNLIVVGSSGPNNNVGRVHYFDTTGAAITNFGQNSGTGNFFGNTVKISDTSDYVFISAPEDDIDTTDAGTVEVRDFSGNYIKNLYSPTGNANSDKFGAGMDVSNGFLYVGAPGKSGVGYFSVFDSNVISLIGIRLTTNVDDYPIILDPNNISNGRFGSHVVAKDGRLVISSEGNASSTYNGVFLYDVSDGITQSIKTSSFDGNSFIQISNPSTSIRELDTFVNPNAQFFDSGFGSNIAVEGDDIFVCEYLYDSDTLDDAGRVSVYDRESKTLKFTLESPVGTATNFGFGIAVDKNYIAVCESNTVIGGNTQGSVYIFDRSGNYLRQVYAVNDDGISTFPYSSVFFGNNNSIALKDGLLVVGAWGLDETATNYGAAFIFDPSTGDLIKYIRGSDTDAAVHASMNMGKSIAVGEGIIALGAPGAEYSGTTAYGLLMLFDYAGNFLRSIQSRTSTNAETGAGQIVIQYGAVYFTSNLQIHKYSLDGSEIWTAVISSSDFTSTTQVPNIQLNKEGTELYVIGGINDGKILVYDALTGLKKYDFPVDSSTNLQSYIVGPQFLRYENILYIGSLQSSTSPGGIFEYALPSSDQEANPVGFGTTSFSTELFYKTNELDYVYQSNPVHLLGDEDADTGGWSVRLKTKETDIPPTLEYTLSETGVNYGESGAIGEDIILVGDPSAANDGNPSASGQVYAYDLDGNSLFSLVDTTPTLNNFFGCSIAVDNGFIAIGANGYNSSAGKVNVYSYNNNGAYLQYSLAPASSGEEFGIDLALKDGLLVVGTDGTGPSGGEVFVYDVSTGNLLHTLNPSDGLNSTGYGLSVDVGYGKILVASPNSIEEIYLYDYDGNELVLIKPTSLQYDSAIGSKVQLAEDGIIAGSDKGGILKYDFDGNIVWRRRDADDSVYTTNTLWGRYFDIDQNLILITKSSSITQTDEVQLWGIDGKFIQRFSGDLGSNLGFGSNAVSIRNGIVLIGSSNEAYVFRLKYSLDKISFKYRNLLPESGSSRFERKIDDYTKTQSALTTPYNTDFDFGSGDFTIEAWINVTNPVSRFINSTSYEQTIISLWGETSSDQVFKLEIDPLGRPQAKFTFVGPTTLTLTSPSELSSNTWYHVAVTRSSDVYKLYVDGVEKVAATDAGTLVIPTTVDLSVGAINSGSFPIDGYISNARITKGISVYTIPFTPSRRKFDVGYQSDFGSVKFDTNDKLVLSTNSDLHLNTDNWAITCWIRPTTLSFNSTVVGIWNEDANNRSWYIEFANSGNVNFYLSTNGTSTTTTINGPILNLSEWHHLEVRKDLNNIVLYVNGAYAGHASAATPYDVGTGEFLVIGDGFGGFISNLHAIKETGQPREYVNDYSGAQTLSVPTAEFGENTTNDIFFDNVSLLLHFNSGPTIVDSSSNSITGFTNTATIDGPAAKFGVSGLNFNNSGYLILPTDNLLDMGEDNFTIEGFFQNSGAGDVLLSSTHIDISFPLTSVIRLSIDGKFFDYTIPNYNSSNWYHWIVERSGNVILLYIDGVVVPYTWNTGGSTFTLSGGRLGANNTGTDIFNGYLDEFRLTTGVARYRSLYFGSPTTPSTVSYTRPVDIVATEFGGSNTDGYLRVAKDYEFNFGMSDRRSGSFDTTAEHPYWAMDFWFFPNALPTLTADIIEAADGTGWEVQLSTSGLVTVFIVSGGSGAGASVGFARIAEWNHLIVYRIAQTVYYIFNGELKQTRSLSGYNNLRTTGDSNFGVRFDGKIANFIFLRDERLRFENLVNRFYNVKYGDRPIDLSPFDGYQVDDENPYSLIRSTKFDGSSALVAPADFDFDFGSGDFTIEFNILHNSSSGNTNRGIVSLWNESDSRRSWKLELTNNTTIVAEVSNDGAAVTTLTGTVSEDTWNHVIFVRVGNTLELYVNGVSQATSAYALPVYSNSVDEVVIGKINSASSNGYVGNISNLRILKGTGLYGLGMDLSENRVDPFNSALPGTHYIGDTYISNNRSSNALPATSVISNTSATTGSMKFNGGASDYVIIASHNSFIGDLNARNDRAFSIECWIRYDSAVTDSTIVRNGAQYELGVVSGNVVFEVSSGTYTATSTTTLVTGQWYHIAAIRTDAGSSSLLNLYIDGTREASVAGPTGNNSNGSTTYRFGENHDGWISNFRFVLGAEVYSGTSFTVPTKELSIFEYPSSQLAPRTGIIAFTQSTIQSNSYAAKYLCDNYTTSVTGTVTADTLNPGLTRDIFTTSLSACRTDNILYEETGKILSESGTPQVGPGAPDWACKLALFNSSEDVFVDRLGRTVNSTNTPLPTVYAVTENFVINIDTPLYACTSQTDVTDNSLLDKVYVDPNPLKLSVVSNPEATDFTPDFDNDASGNINSLLALQSTSNSSIESGGKILASFSPLSLTQDVTGKSLTLSGNPTTITSPDGIGFDTVSFNFDSSSYIEIASASDLQLQSSNFTIEFWVKLRNLSSSHYIISKWDPADSAAASEFYIQIEANGRVSASLNHTTREEFTTDPATITENTWYHVALTRSATTIKLFVNGVESASGTFSNVINSTANDLTIGTQRANLTTSRLNGQISNLRIVKGSSLYNTNFTVPTSPLTNITDTSLLLTASPVDIVNASTFNPTQNPTGAVYFNGTDNFLSIADESVVGYGTDNFTIECWVNTTNNTLSGAQQRTIFGSDSSDAQGQLFIEQGTGNVGFGNTTGGFFNIKSTTSVTDGLWHHIAAVKANDVATLYIDGTSEASAANTVNYVAPVFSFVSNPGFGTTAGEIVTTGWDAETGSTLTYSGGDFATLSRDTTSIDGQWVHTKFLNTIPGELYVVETDVSSTTDDFIIGIGSTNDTTNFTHSTDIFVTDTTTATGSRIERSFKFKATTTDTAIALGIIGSTAQSASIYKLDVYTSNDNIFIGSSNASGGFFEGAISNFSIANNAVYNGDFTLPSKEINFSYGRKLICCNDETNLLSDGSGKIESPVRLLGSTFASIDFDENFYLQYGGGTNYQLNSDPFTMEFFIKFTETSLSGISPRNIYTLDTNDTSSLSANFGVVISDGSTAAYTPGTIALRSGSYFMANDTPINDGEWHHVAITRGDGGADTHRIYIDGVEDATATDKSQSYNSGTACTPIIGSVKNGSSVRDGFLKAKISNFRLTTNEVVYTTGSSFTPPTSPLQLTDNTAHLISADTRDGVARELQTIRELRFTSDVNYISSDTAGFTRYGTSGSSESSTPIPVVDDNPFSSTKLYSYSGIGGTSITYQSVNSFDAKDWYNYKDFTIEFYINPNSFGHGDLLNSNVISHSNPSGTQTRNLIDYSSGIPGPSGSPGDQIYVLPGGSPSISGYPIYVFDNNSTTIFSPAVGAGVTLGNPLRVYQGQRLSVKCEFDNLSTFQINQTINTTRGAKTSGFVDITDSLTFTNGVFDITEIGRELNGSNFNLSIRDIEIDGELVIDSAYGSYKVVDESSFSQNPTVDEHWSFGPNFAGLPTFYYWNGSENRLLSSQEIKKNVWSHLALVKNGDTIKMYVNGTETASAAYAGGATSNLDYPVMIGRSLTNNFDGRISGFKMSSSAVYTSNFTPTFEVSTSTNFNSIIHSSNNDLSAPTDSSSKVISSNAESYIGPSELALPENVTSSDLKVKEITQDLKPYSTPTGRYIPNAKVFGGFVESTVPEVNSPENMFNGVISTTESDAWGTVILQAGWSGFSQYYHANGVEFTPLEVYSKLEVYFTTGSSSLNIIVNDIYAVGSTSPTWVDLTDYLLFPPQADPVIKNTFDDSSSIDNWVADNSNVTWDSGNQRISIQRSGGTGLAAYRDMQTTSGKTYSLTCDFTTSASGINSISVNDGQGVANTLGTQIGIATVAAGSGTTPVTFTFTAQSTTTNIRIGIENDTETIFLDNLVVKDYPGNPAYLSKLSFDPRFAGSSAEGFIWGIKIDDVLVDSQYVQKEGASTVTVSNILTNEDIVGLTTFANPDQASPASLGTRVVTNNSETGGLYILSGYGEVGGSSGIGTLVAYDQNANVLDGISSNNAFSLFGIEMDANPDMDKIIVGAYQARDAYYYEFLSNTFSQIGSDITGSTSISGDNFGRSIAISDDGSKFVIGANSADVGTTVDGGKLYVFERVNTTFNEVGILTATNLNDNSKLGFSVEISGDGNRIFSGAPFVDQPTGVTDGGAVFVYDYNTTNSQYEQVGIITSSLQSAYSGTKFGFEIESYSPDAETVFVYFEDPGFTLTGSTGSGAVVVYDYDGTNYNEVNTIRLPNLESANSKIGLRMSVSKDGSRLALLSVAHSSSFPPFFTSTCAVHILDRIDNNFYLSESIFGNDPNLFDPTFPATYFTDVKLCDNDEAVIIGVGPAQNDAQTVNNVGKGFRHNIKQTEFDRAGISQRYDGVITISEVYKRLSSETIYLAGTTTDGHIIRSIDGGENWTETDLSLRVSEINSFADTYNNGIIFASAVSKNAGVDLLWKSTDYGISWSPETTPTATSEVGTFVSFNDAIHIKDGIMLVVGRISSTQNVIFRSTDYGATWTDIDVATSVGFGSFDFIKNLTYCDNSEVIVANFAAAGAGQQGILRSTDYGLTWSHIVTSISFTDVEGQTLSIESTDFEISFAYDFTTNVLIGAAKRIAIPNATIKAYQGGIVIKSTDLGATWTSATSESYLIGRGFTGIADGGGGGVFFAGDEKGRVFVSSDKGVTWSRYNIKHCYYISSIAHINGRLLLGSEKIENAEFTDIFYTDDNRDYFLPENNGWNHLIVGREDNLVAFVYNNEIVYQSDLDDPTIDNIYYSDDGNVYVGGTPEIESNFEGLITHVRVQSGESLYQLDDSATSSNVFVKVNGNWRRAREVYIRVNGVWRRAENDLIQVKDSNTTPTWSSWYSPTT